MNNDEEAYYDMARKRARRKKKFYARVLTWIVLSVFFIILNIATSDYFWAIFPILGIGIGIAIQAISIYTDEWEDHQVENEYRRLRERNMNQQGETLDSDNNYKHWNDKDFV